LDLEMLVDHKSPYMLMMPSQKTFVETMKKFNIKLSDRVVCYETGATQLFHYRVAWMFKVMGHKNVQVLRGGYPKWVAEGRPVVITDDTAKAEDFDYKVDES